MPPKTSQEQAYRKVSALARSICWKHWRRKGRGRSRPAGERPVALAFGVYWALTTESALHYAGISALDIGREAETLLARFPNAAVNPEERRKLRRKLYSPVIKLEAEDRSRIVDLTLSILLDGGDDVDA